jgi:flavin reductase (DIM6/NTAB) family NADH-FMN oxidoreductase RutF/rubredoxin
VSCLSYNQILPDNSEIGYKNKNMNIEAFYKISYGLYAVCSKSGTKLNGYISNTVFQVTSDPARFAISCSKNNFTAKIISESSSFSISVLEKDTGPGIIGTFGYRSGKDTEKFRDVKYKTGKTGSPILLDNAIAWFECKVIASHDVGSHILFIGELVDSELLMTEKEPLTYAYYRDIKKGKAPKNAPTYIDENKTETARPEKKADKYYCPACGYVYDPELGDPDSGIAPGTRFEDIPDNWICPTCGTEKADFVKVGG